MRGLVVVFLLFVCSQVALCTLYGPKSDVVTLTKKNFAEKVFSTEHIWIVEFFAPWCGHCKNLAPEYDKAATNLKGLVKLGAVNCDDEKELCGNFGVQGFPTLKFFPSKPTPVQGKTDAYHKVPEDYQGGRTAAAIVSYALGKLPSFVVPVSSSSEEKFLSQQLPKAILFTNKDKTSDLYKALSIDYHYRMALGEAKHTDKKLVEKYKVTNFPTLLVLGKEQGDPNIPFEGKLSHEALFKFLQPFAAPPPQQQEKPSSGSEKKKVPEAEPETGEVHEIKSQEDFDKYCVNKGGICAVGFLDIENSDKEEYDKYVDILKSVGEAYKGRLRVIYMDGPSQPEFTRAMDISALYPSLALISPNKLRYTPYKGSFSEESISAFFDAVFSGKRSFELEKIPSVRPQPSLHHRVPPQEEEEEEEENLKDEI